MALVGLSKVLVGYTAMGSAFIFVALCRTSPCCCPPQIIAAHVPKHAFGLRNVYQDTGFTTSRGAEGNGD